MVFYLKCAVCQNEGDSVKLCSKCRTVAYCSVQHQKEDWRMHKKSCWPILVQKWNGEESAEVEVDQVELECVASRDVEAGEIVFEETPILISPEKTTRENGVLNCLTCGVAVGNVPSVRKCSGCGWPICSKACEKDKLHAENECKMFQEIGVPVPPSVSSVSSSRHEILIFMLRGLNLRSSNPALFQKVMELKDNFPVHACHIDLCDLSRKAGKKLNRLLKSSLDEQALKVCEKVFRIRRVNSFSGSSDGQLQSETSGNWTAVYDKGSRFNHSCVPNCDFSFSGFPQYKMRVIAAAPLKRGDALTISYYGTNYDGTFERQRSLKSQGGFYCRCPRCLDPTECGTFASAFKCQEPSCKSGFYLPVDPLDLTSTSLYRCNQCHKTECSSFLRSMAELLVEGLKDQGETMRNLISFIGNGCGPNDMFHKNHWIIQTATEKILELEVPPSPGSIEMRDVRKRMEKFMERLKYLLEIDRKIYPGTSDRKAKRLLQLSSVSLSALQLYGHLLSFQELTSLAQECRAAQKEILWMCGKQFFINEKSDKLHPAFALMSKMMPIQWSEAFSQALVRTQNFQKYLFNFIIASNLKS